MLPYVDQISQLARLQDPEALRLAQELLLDLADNTTSGIGDDGKACGYGDRPSDPKCDELLYNILEKRADVFDMESEAVQQAKKRIEDTSRNLEGYGIEPWFPRSLELLREFEYSY